MDVMTFLLAITTVTLMVAMTMALISGKHQAKGMELGALALVALACGILLFAYRPLVGPTASILVGNLLICAGIALFSEAVLLCQKRHVERWKVWLPLPLLALVLVGLMHDAKWRGVGTALLFLAQTLILLTIIIRGRHETPGLGWRIVAAGAVAFASIIAVRGVAALQDVSLIDSLTRESWIQSLTYLIGLNAIVLCAIGLIAMSIEDSERNLRLAEQKFRAFIENANDVVYTLDTEGHFDYLSPNVQLSLGYDVRELQGQHFSAIIHPEDLPACESFFGTLISTGQASTGLEYRARHRDGSWRWHDTNASPLLDGNNQLRGMLGIGRDIHQRKLDKIRLDQLAHFDSLTGLPNRMLIIDRLESALRHAKRNSKQVAILFLDLDGFKLINDRHGHDVGDSVLREVANRLNATLRESDSVGRFGGDEYVVLLPDVEGEEQTREVAQRIEDAVTQPMQASGVTVAVGCSIGIALYPEHGDDVDSLIPQADAAMYRIKRAGGGVHESQTQCAG